MKVPTGAEGPWPKPPIGTPATATDLPGLWTRSLLRWSLDGEPDDTETVVRWLQGERWYIDLRQNPHRPDFGTVSSCADLGVHHLRWMLAHQDAFAGQVLTEPATPGCFTWQHHIEWDPTSSGVTDCGSLYFESTTLVERGLELPYLEHWHRDASADGPTAAVLASDPHSEAIAIVLRAGNHFAVARSRNLALELALPDGGGAEVTREQLLPLIDCEFSFGVVAPAGWRITASTWPFLEGRESTWEVDRVSITMPSATNPHSMLVWPIRTACGALDLFDRPYTPAI